MAVVVMLWQWLQVTSIFINSKHFVSLAFFLKAVILKTLLLDVFMLPVTALMKTDAISTMYGELLKATVKKIKENRFQDVIFFFVLLLELKCEYNLETTNLMFSGGLVMASSLPLSTWWPQLS